MSAKECYRQGRRCREEDGVNDLPIEPCFRSDCRHDRLVVRNSFLAAASFDDQVKSGKAKLVGDQGPFDLLMSMLVNFDMGFEKMPGTAAGGTE